MHACLQLSHRCFISVHVLCGCVVVMVFFILMRQWFYPLLVLRSFVRRRLYCCISSDTNVIRYHPSLILCWVPCGNSGRVTTRQWTRLPLSMLYTNLLCGLNTMFDKTLFFLLLAVLSSSAFATFSRNYPNKDHDKAKEGKCWAKTELQITNCDMQAVS